MKILYQGLLRITRGVVRDAEAVVQSLPARPRPRVQPLVARLHATLAVVTGAVYRSTDIIEAVLGCGVRWEEVDPRKLDGIRRSLLKVGAII